MLNHRLVSISFLFLTMSVGGFAQETCALRLITTEGQGEVKVVPDQAHIALGVEVRDKSLASGKSRNDSAVVSVLKAVAGFGIDSKDVQAAKLEIEPQYNQNGEGQVLEFYRIEKRIDITMRDLKRFDDLLTAALQAGANRIESISFETSEPRRYMDEARRLAVVAAKEKAVAMARELDATVGKVHSMSEGSPFELVTKSSTNASMSYEYGSSNFGQIPVTAEVSVSFELQ